MKKIATSYINDSIKSSAWDFMLESESGYEQQISYVAEKLAEKADTKPIVLLSGPSGSGKTTTALRIEALLDAMGYPTHTISMDNYFLSAKDNEKARDHKGNIDYESPMRLDIELFSRHLEQLADCEEIQIPKFDFVNQCRTEGYNLKRNKNELVILEGIHALNPLVTGEHLDFANCIYVSVRTRIENETGQLLHPSMIRLMRRLLRDKMCRGRDFAETMDFFNSVQRGENLYIMPFKSRADFEIDTFLPYEVSVYKEKLLPELVLTRESYDDYYRYSDMEKFLNELISLDNEVVPKNSLVREFLGDK